MPVVLENNRISGDIPTSFYNMLNISILGSNTFSCNFDQSDLPQHDPGRRQYHCGSNSFDILYYLWLGMMGGSILAVGYYFWKYEGFLQSFVRTDALYRSTALYDTPSAIRRTSLQCTVYIVAILLPLYCVCSVYYVWHSRA